MQVQYLEDERHSWGNLFLVRKLERKLLHREILRKHERFYDTLPVAAVFIFCRN